MKFGGLVMMFELSLVGQPERDLLDLGTGEGFEDSEHPLMRSFGLG